MVTFQQKPRRVQKKQPVVGVENDAVCATNSRFMPEIKMAAPVKWLRCCDVSNTLRTSNTESKNATVSLDPFYQKQNVCPTKCINTEMAPKGPISSQLV